MRGFTLIETIIYLGLFSLLVTGTVSSLINVGSSAERIEAGSRLTDEGHFILEKLRSELERATVIKIGEDSLEFESEDGTTSFYLQDGSLVRDAGDGILRSTEPGSKVTDLSFSAVSDGSIAISFSLEVRTKGGNPLTSRFSETFYSMYP